MTVKLSKKEQLQILDELRYGEQWPKIKQSILNVQYTLPQQSSSLDSVQPKLTYNLPGSKKKLQVNESQLKRMSAVQTEFLSNQSQLQTQPFIATSSAPVEKQDRYFMQQAYKKRCKNCLEMDHKTQFCLQSTTCIYCLSTQHYTFQCQQKNICFKCYEIGHQYDECKEKQGRNCMNCQRMHIKVSERNSTVCYSLTKGRDDKKHLFPTDSFYMSEDILCMRCRKFGHLICTFNGH